jgi:hypothetical protein
MKFILASVLLASTTLASVVPRAGQKVDYDGFKAVRVTLPEGSESVKAQIEDLVAHILNPGKKEFDVVVAPQDVTALKALVSESKVINENVGAALKEEGGFQAYAGMMSPTFHFMQDTEPAQFHLSPGSRRITLTPTISSSCETSRLATPATPPSSPSAPQSRAALSRVSRFGAPEAAVPGLL